MHNGLKLLHMNFNQFVFVSDWSCPSICNSLNYQYIIQWSK